MKLTKPEEEHKDNGLSWSALTCGLVAAVAYDRGLRIGDMAVGWDQETGNSFFHSDLVEKINTRNQSGELYKGASEDTLQGIAAVMCAVGIGGAKACDDIGSTICCATCPEPAILSTVMGGWALKRAVRGWWVYQMKVVNNIQDESGDVIEAVAAALQERGSLTGAEIKAIVVSFA